MITGEVNRTTEREAWEWFRNPMPPAKEADVIFGYVRNAIDLPDSKFVTDLPTAKSRTRTTSSGRSSRTTSWQRTNGLTFFQQEQSDRAPRRSAPKGDAGKRGVDPADSGRHPSRCRAAAPAMFDGLGLRTSSAFDIAYEAAEKFTKAFGKRQKAAGFLKGLLRQRICSSVAVGSGDREEAAGRPPDRRRRIRIEPRRRKARHRR